MNRWAVFLRGVNVGGHGKLAMAELRDALPEMGAQNSATYIQSGNIVFSHDSHDANQVAQQVERVIQQRFGFHPLALAYSADALDRLISSLPTAEAAQGKVAGSNIYVYLTFNGPDIREISPLLDYCTQGESLHRLATGLAVIAPMGIGRSKLTAPLEKLLAGQATARNLNTLRRVQELLKGKSV